jgi:hypothetical protein
MPISTLRGTPAEKSLPPCRLLKSAALLVAAALAGCGGTHPPNPLGPQAEAPPVDTLLLRGVTSYLADDALEGRGTGTRGGRLAAAYLASECRRLGLVPLAGDRYDQDVPLVRATIVPGATSVRIVGPGVDTTFAHGENFLVDVGNDRTLRDFAGELAYVGQAREVLWRRSDLPPLEGRIALLRGELGGYGAAADTLYGRGAVGLIQVVDDARRYRLFRATRGEARLFPADPAIPSSFVPPLPAILAGPRMTVTLYQPLTGVAAGSWNDAYLNGLAAGLPAPQVLRGWRAEVHIASSAAPPPVPASNVACLLPGRERAERAERAIVVSAHYDHLGIAAPDRRGDSVYNGFSDNAAGVAMALGIGEAFGRERRSGGGLTHSLILLFFTGEEQGLLGSDYFVARPLWPLDRIAGVINLDANAPPARPLAWRVAAAEGDPLVELVRRQAALGGWQLAVAPAAPASDYYPFIRHGVPAVFLMPGEGAYEGLSLTASDSLRSLQWTRYHQPDDAWDERFPFEGLERYAELAAGVVLRLDRGDAGGAPLARGYRSGSAATGPGGSR